MRTNPCVFGVILLAVIVLAPWTAPAQLRIGANPNGAKKILKVLYITERSIRGGADHRKLFGFERAPIHFGICEVGIPPKHKIGSLESSTFSWDPTTDVVFSSVELHDEFAPLLMQLRTDLKPNPHVFIFIHGYANSFESAGRRTAQMWDDLNLEGVPIMYSWASQGSPRNFLEDKETVHDWTSKQFGKFLRMLTGQTEDVRVHLVAHSMGSRPLMEALATIGTSTSPTASQPFDQIVLFAPEIPSKQFQELVPQARQLSRRLSVYASAEDEALQFIRRIFPEDKEPRTGDLRSSPTDIKGIDVIEATSINYTLNGHDYYANNRIVLSDLREVLEGVPVEQRKELQRSISGHYEFRR